VIPAILMYKLDNATH